MSLLDRIKNRFKPTEEPIDVLAAPADPVVEALPETDGVALEPDPVVLDQEEQTEETVEPIIELVVPEIKPAPPIPRSTQSVRMRCNRCSSLPDFVTKEMLQDPAIRRNYVSLYGSQPVFDRESGIEREEIEQPTNPNLIPPKWRFPERNDED